MSDIRFVLRYTSYLFESSAYLSKDMNENSKNFFKLNKKALQILANINSICKCTGTYSTNKPIAIIWISGEFKYCSFQKLIHTVAIVVID
jgi:hypothetical protein